MMSSINLLSNCFGKFCPYKVESSALRNDGDMKKAFLFFTIFESKPPNGSKTFNSSAFVKISISSLMSFYLTPIILANFSGFISSDPASLRISLSILV